MLTPQYMLNNSIKIFFIHFRNILFTISFSPKKRKHVYQMAGGVSESVKGRIGVVRDQKGATRERLYANGGPS